MEGHSHDMFSLIGLLLVGLIFPCLWGVLVHRAVSALWPLEKRRGVAWSDTTEAQRADEFLDYQI